MRQNILVGKLAFSPTDGSEQRRSSAYLGYARASPCVWQASRAPRALPLLTVDASHRGWLTVGVVPHPRLPEEDMEKTRMPVRLRWRPSVGGQTQNLFSPR